MPFSKERKYEKVSPTGSPLRKQLGKIRVCLCLLLSAAGNAERTRGKAQEREGSGLSADGRRATSHVEP